MLGLKLIHVSKNATEIMHIYSIHDPTGYSQASTLLLVSTDLLLKVSPWVTTAPSMMTSSNGNIFRVTGPLCGNSPITGEFPAQRPVTRSFDVFFDLRLNERLSKQSRGWLIGTLSRPLWRQSNEIYSAWNPNWKMPICDVYHNIDGM